MTAKAASLQTSFANAFAIKGAIIKVEDCWIAYFDNYAAGEGMHYVVAVAASADRAERLLEERANELARGNSTTAPLGETLEKHPAIRDVIPHEVHSRTSEGLCWTLEYFGMIDSNCA